MIGFNGTVYHQVDDKGRVRIPSKFFPKDAESEEDKSGRKFVFMAGPQGCIAVYLPESLEERIERLRNLPNDSVMIVSAKRKILGSIEYVETDKQGRVVIPTNLRDHAKIGRELVSVGMDDHFEIWSKAEFERQDMEMSFDRAYSEIGFF